MAGSSVWTSLRDKTWVGPHPIRAEHLSFNFTSLCRTWRKCLFPLKPFWVLGCWFLIKWESGQFRSKLLLFSGVFLQYTIKLFVCLDPSVSIFMWGLDFWKLGFISRNLLFFKRFVHPVFLMAYWPTLSVLLKCMYCFKILHYK